MSAREGAAAAHKAEDQQQQEGPDERGDDAGAPPGPVPADSVADPAGDHRAGNAQQHGDDAPARVTPGHQQLGDRASKAPDDDPADDPVMFHSLPFRVLVLSAVQPAFTSAVPTRACETGATVSRKAVAGAKRA